MAGWGARIVGVNSVLNTLDGLRAEWTGEAVGVVGTNVEYAIWVEFGTSRAQAQPYLRPAIEEFNASPRGFIADHTETSFASIGGLDHLIEAVGFAIERRAKELAPVDTGNLRSSIRFERIR